VGGIFAEAPLTGGSPNSATAAALPISVPVRSAEICPLVMQIFAPRPEARWIAESRLRLELPICPAAVRLLGLVTCRRPACPRGKWRIPTKLQVDGGELRAGGGNIERKVPTMPCFASHELSWGRSMLCWWKGEISRWTELEKRIAR
jgi:hypothetical protein